MNLCPPGVWFADVMASFSGVTFVLFRFALLRFVFRLYAFVEAAALRPIVLRYAGAPIAARDSFLLFVWGRRFFRVFFVRFPIFHCMESTPYVLSFRMVFFYLVTTGWIFYISLLCENSTNRKSKLSSQAISFQLKSCTHARIGQYLFRVFWYN